MFKRTTWSFFSGSQFTFGPGSVGSLAGVIERRQAKRVFVISDRVLESTGLVSHVVAAIAQTQATSKRFLDGEVEPSTDLIATVADQATEFRPDLFVALGGGSNMDLAKAVASVHTHACRAEKLIGFDAVPGPVLPLVCLPTTAGTGSEMTHSAIIRNSTTGKKASILSQHVRPNVAIVDPQLTLSCPAKVTAESGIDALTHAIEAYLVTNFYSFSENLEHGLPYEGNHPLGDMYAEKAIRLIGESLHRAVDEPENLAARSSMAFAATLAGAAFSTCGVSLAHALEYPIGSKYKCSHGAGNGIVLPAVMRFWLASRQSRVAKIASMLGVAGADQMPDQEAAHAAIEAVERLRSDIGLPTCLSDVGAKSEDLVELATTAISLQRLLDLSPVNTTFDDAKNILRASL
ncbi:iron-containing alcohol dehydrogenase [bacterium]|nr:iron-containing alcohol dehydrogenase [bacterium]